MSEIYPEKPRTIYVRACPPTCGMFDCARCWEAGIALMEGCEVKRYGGHYGYDKDDEDEDDAEAAYRRENDVAEAFAKSEGEKGYLKRCREYVWRWENL